MSGTGRLTDALGMGAIVAIAVFSLVGVQPSIGLQSISITVFVLAVMVRTVTSRLQRLDPALEEAAANLGATLFQSLRTVTFPLLQPAIMAGAVFTFVEGFDNLSVAIFTHGFRDRPLPVELLALVQHTSSPLAARRRGVGGADSAGDCCADRGLGEHRARQRQRLTGVQRHRPGGSPAARSGAASTAAWISRGVASHTSPPETIRASASAPGRRLNG